MASWKESETEKKLDEALRRISELEARNKDLQRKNDALTAANSRLAEAAAQNAMGMRCWSELLAKCDELRRRSSGS